MAFRYADPAMDAEAHYQHVSANRRMFELENYKDDCPYCGRPMYEGAYSIDENWVYDERIDDYAHELCSDRAAEEAS